MDGQTQTVTETQRTRMGTGTIEASPTIEKTSSTAVVEDISAHGQHTRDVATRVVWFLMGVIDVILLMRVVLEGLGANPANAFASFIYSISAPLVAPFAGLFNYTIRNSVSQLDLYAIIAMAVYTVICFGGVKLININRQ